MKTFKEFYEERYGQYPGEAGELYDKIFSRITNAVGEYVDEVLAPAAEKAAHPRSKAKE